MYRGRERLFVEVKGATTRPWSVELTAPEHRVASRERDRYRMSVVIFAGLDHLDEDELVEAGNQHIRIQRTRNDSCFDGTPGKRLAKIIHFGHPLTVADLEVLRQELEARPGEDRDIVVVCLGAELATDAWVSAWNRHRPLNRLEVIELRTDQKYGKFFVHQPAQAEVEIHREGEQVVIEITDFISPTIVERLNMDNTIVRAQITDWRAMVDCVVIDTAYDGVVFHWH